MLAQEVLGSHDGRPGGRGSVVNVASQLGIVGRPAAREFFYPNPFRFAIVFGLFGLLGALADFSGSSCVLWVQGCGDQYDEVRCY